MKTEFNHEEFENIDNIVMTESNFYKWLKKNGYKWGEYRDKNYQYYNLYILSVTEYLKSLGFNKKIHSINEKLLSTLRHIYLYFYYVEFAQKNKKIKQL